MASVLKLCPSIVHCTYRIVRKWEKVSLYLLHEYSALYSLKHVHLYLFCYLHVAPIKDILFWIKYCNLWYRIYQPVKWMATGLSNWGMVSNRDRDFYFWHCLQTGSWVCWHAHLPILLLLLNVYTASFPRVSWSRCEADFLSPCHIEV